MANIFLFTTDALGQDEIITAQTTCKQIVVREDNQGQTAGFLLRRIGVADPQTTIPAGGEFTFHPRNGGLLIMAGDIVARIAAASGSLNMVQIED